MFHGSAVAAASSASASATAGIRAWSPGIHESSPVEYYYRSISCTKKIDDSPKSTPPCPDSLCVVVWSCGSFFFGCYFDATSSAVSTVPFHSLEMEGGKEKEIRLAVLWAGHPAVRLRWALEGCVRPR
jgi:hypothetical protein